MRRVQVALVRWVSRAVGAVKRQRLEWLMRGGVRRRAILRLFFRAMPRALRRRTLERERLVVGWRVGGRSDGGHDSRQLVIEDGRAEVIEGEPREANLTLIVDGADLLLLATGNADARRLYVRGEVDFRGDPWLAMRLPGLFAVGGARSQAGSR